MLIYILLLSVLIIAAISLNIHSKRRNEKLFLIFSFLLFTLIAALRSENIGVDTLQFTSFYKSLTLINEFPIFSNYRYEYGFTFLCWLLSRISDSPQLLLLVTSVFINVVVARFIYKNSKNVYLSTILYLTCNYYFQYMNIMRQAIAIAFVLLAYENLKEKKYFNYVIFTLLGCLFHFSAILSFLFIFLKKIKLNRKVIFITIISIILAFAYGNNFFAFLASISPRLNGYLGSQYDVTNYFGALILMVVQLVIFLTGIILLRKNKSKISRNNNIGNLIGIIAIATIFSTLTIKVNIFNRFTPYFSIFNIIWLPNVVNEVKNSKNRLLLIVIIVSLFICYWLIIMIFRPEWHGVVPYEFLIKN